jgi:hypothetical protein
MREETMQIEDYFKIIDKAAENSEDFEISNRDAQHASYLIKTLFHHAAHEVCVFTGSLYDGVFGNEAIKKEAINFLRKDSTVKLKVAFQENVSNEEVLSGSFMKYVLGDPERKGSIEVYNASKAYPGITNHFSVSDGKAFRYEIDHVTRRAVANFGDKKNAQILASVFDKIISKSEKVFATKILADA